MGNAQIEVGRKATGKTGWGQLQLQGHEWVLGCLPVPEQLWMENAQI